MDGNYFLIYTTAEGGLFKVPLHKGTAMIYEPEDFDALVHTGELILEAYWDKPGDAPEPEALIFVALVQVIRNHDFVLGHSRDHFPQGSDQKPEPGHGYRVVGKSGHMYTIPHGMKEVWDLIDSSHKQVVKL